MAFATLTGSRRTGRKAASLAGGEEKKEGEERKEKKEEKGPERGEEETEDESWGTWSGAGSSRDPLPPEASGRERASAKAKASGGTSSVTGVGLRAASVESCLLTSREKAKDDAEREAIDCQLDEVKEQLKALLQKKKEGAAVPKAGQKSARHQADLDAGHKPKLAKRKELSKTEGSTAPAGQPGGTLEGAQGPGRRVAQALRPSPGQEGRWKGSIVPSDAFQHGATGTSFEQEGEGKL